MPQAEGPAGSSIRKGRRRKEAARGDGGAVPGGLTGPTPRSHMSVPWVSLCTDGLDSVYFRWFPWVVVWLGLVGDCGPGGVPGRSWAPCGRRAGSGGGHSRTRELPAP